MRQLPLRMRLRERAVFDSFVGGANAAAVARLQALASGSAHGVEWLDGPSGVGKSHLLQAACALATAHGFTAAYLPLAQLHDLGAEILEGWQDARLIALDDADVIAGERAWEQGVFRLHREAGERQASLLLAARAPARQLRWSLADLGSRLAAANLLTLQPLDEAQQREALRLRARARGLELPEEAALYLQRHFRRELTALYELLDAIDEAALQAQRRITLPFIREVLLARPPGAE